MKKQVKAVCEACKGTGLYQGIAERDGAFVICHNCNGTGCETISYEPFEERKKQSKCKRVYKSGYGYVISDKDMTLADGTFIPMSKLGVSYEEFLNGKKPKHVREFGCPMLLDQGACHNKKGFVDKCNKLNGGWIDFIPECKNYCNNKECWERFDK